MDTQVRQALALTRYGSVVFGIAAVVSIWSAGAARANDRVIGCWERTNAYHSKLEEGKEIVQADHYSLCFRKDSVATGSALEFGCGVTWQFDYWFERGIIVQDHYDRAAQAWQEVRMPYRLSADGRTLSIDHLEGSQKWSLRCRKESEDSYCSLLTVKLDE